MPISEVPGYSPGHFSHVFKNIIAPACEAAGYKPVRADEVAETNFIQADILKRLVDTPMAICDLSTRNPNVLFELGLRQAFDKPVVLIQEIGTAKIFDISVLRYLEYSKEMRYHEVLETQKLLTQKIIATAEASNDSSNTNSIIKLLALQKAELPNVENNREVMELSFLQSELRELKNLVKSLITKQSIASTSSTSTKDFLWPKKDEWNEAMGNVEITFHESLKKADCPTTRTQLLEGWKSLLTQVLPVLDNKVAKVKCGNLLNRIENELLLEGL